MEIIMNEDFQFGILLEGFLERVLIIFAGFYNFGIYLMQ